MMVGRIRKPSATPDEASEEKAADDSSSKSPKTGYTSEVDMLIMLMFFAIIGIGVSVCNISKKRG